MQTKKAANKAMDRYVRNVLGCGGVLITSEQSHAVDLLSIHHLERWAVTQGPQTIHKTGQIGVVGACSGMGACVEMVSCPG